MGQEATKLRLARMRIVRFQTLLVVSQPSIDASWNTPVNSVGDFCLFAPPKPGPDSLVGDSEVGHPSGLLVDNIPSPDPFIHPGNHGLLVYPGLLHS